MADYTYNQLQKYMFGLYDRNKEKVEESGLKEPFEQALKDHAYENESTSSDSFRNKNMSVDPGRFRSFLVQVGDRVGYGQRDMDDALDAVLLEEQHDRAEQGLSNALLDSRDPNVYNPETVFDDMKHWFTDGYKDVYGEPYDHDEAQRQHSHDLHREHHVDMDEMFDDEDVMSFSDFEKKIAVSKADDNLKAHGSGQKEDSLFGVSLNAPVDERADVTPSVDAGVEDEYQPMVDFLNQVGEGQYPTSPSMRDYFEIHTNRTVDDWAVSEDDLVKDPDRFKNFLAQTVYRTMTDSDDYADMKNDLVMSDAYTVINRSFGPDVAESDVADFTEGYKSLYRVPIDAYNMTMNEVSVTMGLDEPDGVKGYLKYKDVFEASSPEDIYKLERAEQRRINEEQLDGIDDDYNLKPFDGQDFSDKSQDEDDLEL